MGDSITIERFSSLFEYAPDGKIDSWRILKPEADGRYRGDCDDFALTALFIETGSLSKFWRELIFGSAKVFLVTTSNGGGHAVLRYNGRYIDNWSRSWVSREHMESVYGHKFSFWLFPWHTTAIKMLLGKLRG